MFTVHFLMFGLGVHTREQREVAERNNIGYRPQVEWQAYTLGPLLSARPRLA